ncbi:cation:proton antiporter [Streptomyces californicus]|uniref:cation:proton antiporter n=1 Tax=Streptomyces californicus TaxID=67351 RepID=UPI0037A9C8C6
MDVTDLLFRAAHVAVALAVLLLLAYAGRTAARLLRQPEVVGEVTAGLLIGPAVLALSDRALFDALLPADVIDVLELVGQTGLVLFLVGIAHKLRSGPGGPPRQAVAALATGAFVVPFASGLLLVGLIWLTDDTAARGDGPLPAYLLMVAVAMSITAVPVLSRILGDRGLTESPEGRLSMASAIVIDSIGWLLLTFAIGLGTGHLGGLGRAVGALAAGGACALLLRLGLRTAAARRMCRRLPRTTAVILGAAALGTAMLTEHFGMTAIIGAAMVGLAIPGDDLAPWAEPVAAVSRTGRTLTPVFFVVTGATVLITAFTAASWTLVVGALVLGCAGKLIGGYLGARYAGSSRRPALRTGVLMNSRGLTELIVIEAGYSAGLLPAPLVLALVVMALATTAMTGPLLQAVDRTGRRAGRPRPAPVSRTMTTEGSTR